MCLVASAMIAPAEKASFSTKVYVGTLSLLDRADDVAGGLERSARRVHDEDDRLGVDVLGLLRPRGG